MALQPGRDNNSTAAHLALAGQEEAVEPPKSHRSDLVFPELRDQRWRCHPVGRDHMPVLAIGRLHATWKLRCWWQCQAAW